EASFRRRTPVFASAGADSSRANGLRTGAAVSPRLLASAAWSGNRRRRTGGGKLAPRRLREDRDDPRVFTRRRRAARQPTSGFAGRPSFDANRNLWLTCAARPGGVACAPCPSS